MPFEQAGDDQSDDRDRGLEWEPDDVPKVVALDAANVAGGLRMQKHQYAEAFSLAMVFFRLGLADPCPPSPSAHLFLCFSTAYRSKVSF